MTQVVVCNDNILPEHAFYFLRHGETAYNREGRFQGRIDVPLNEAGLRQARETAAALARSNITRIVSSPAQRVLQTVSHFAEAHGVPVHTEDDLMEFYVGSFEGQYVADIKRQHSLSEHDSVFSVLPPDADKWQEFATRVCSAVRKWIDQYPGETLLFASHGLVFRALTEALTGREMSSRNAQVHRFQPGGDAWVVAIAQPQSAICR